MLQRIALGEVRSVVFIAVKQFEFIIVDEDRGFDHDSLREVCLCGSCHGPMDLVPNYAAGFIFGGKLPKSEILICRGRCGLRVFLREELRKTVDILHYFEAATNVNGICGRCLGEKSIPVMPALLDGTFPKATHVQRVVCPACQGNGSA